MFIRKVIDADGYEARSGAEFVGRYRIVGPPPLAELRIDEALTPEIAASLREHALETARRNGYVQLLLAAEIVPVPEPHLHGDEITRKTLRDFFEGARLKEIPSNQVRREIVLRWLASRFDPGERLSESEVNRRLLRHHPDFAMLRRYLVDHGLLERARGIYWRS